MGLLASRFIDEVRAERVTDIGRLLRDYAAVFIGTGLPAESDLPIGGVGLEGVFHARELLRTVKSGAASGTGRRVGSSAAAMWQSRSHQSFGLRTQPGTSPSCIVEASKN